jgi:hypothetical protein
MMIKAGDGSGEEGGEMKSRAKRMGGGRDGRGDGGTQQGDKAERKGTGQGREGEMRRCGFKFRSCKREECVSSHLKGGGDAAAGPVDVRPPVEHVVGAEEQERGPAQPCTHTRDEKKEPIATEGVAALL